MIPFEEADIQQLQRAMQAGVTTSAQLVRSYMQRIAELDKAGPALNAVLELNPDALAIAEALDAERRERGARGPLHGIPILLKDNIETGDRMHTSAGSWAMRDHYASRDSEVARRLRKAGAVLLGKANMTEWANFMTTGMPPGYSSRGGQVLNPYGPGRFHPGGSSSGSGVAAAAALAAAAIGTETSGSILSPAVQNSVVGIKPTIGLVSRSGIVPLAHSQDTAGPLARSVADAALLLDCLAGIDEADPVTGASLGRIPVGGYADSLDPQGLQGARIGVPRSAISDALTAEDRRIVDGAIARMRDAGAVIVDPAEIPSARELSGFKSSVFRYEFKADLNAYLAGIGPQAPFRTLNELIRFNAQHGDRMLKYDQVLLTASDATSGTLTEPEYILDRLKDLRLSRDEGIDAVISRFQLDALLFPGLAGAAIAAKAGYPSIAVPAGYREDGCPIGVTFSGSAFSEPMLIKLAFAFEQATQARRKPQLG